MEVRDIFKLAELLQSNPSAARTLYSALHQSVRGTAAERTTTFPSPAVGDMWLDTDTGFMTYYNGSEWLELYTVLPS